MVYALYPSGRWAAHSRRLTPEILAVMGCSGEPVELQVFENPEPAADAELEQYLDRKWPQLRREE